LRISETESHADRIGGLAGLKQKAVEVKREPDRIWRLAGLK
jgi:hypothetical protein